MKLIRCEVMTKNSKKEFVTPTKSIDGRNNKVDKAVESVKNLRQYQ